MVKHPLHHCVKWLLLRFILLLPMLPIAYEAVRYRRGIEGVFPPGPLATVHEAFHCKQCHVEPWRGWQKLLGRDQQIGAAMDRACVSVMAAWWMATLRTCALAWLSGSWCLRRPSHRTTRARFLMKLGIAPTAIMSTGVTKDYFSSRPINASAVIAICIP